VFPPPIFSFATLCGLEMDWFWRIGGDDNGSMSVLPPCQMLRAHSPRRNRLAKEIGYRALKPILIRNNFLHSLKEAVRRTRVRIIRTSRRTFERPSST
jgi:hypothetical protein